jgi:hypothetical protein
MENDNNNLIGKWGGADFHIIIMDNKKNDVHPDDWNILMLSPYKHSYHQCVGIDDKYLILQFGYEKIRVTSGHFEAYLEPEFKPLEKIKFLNSKGQLEFGTIQGIHWHGNDKKFYYDVEVNGKIKGRRYFDEDLEKDI